MDHRVLVGLLFMLTIVNPVGACLTTTQQDAIYNISLVTNSSNSTLQGIFTMLCTDIGSVGTKLGDYYDKNYTDLYWKLTKENIDDKLRDIDDVNKTIKALTDEYLEAIEDDLKLVEQLHSITMILNESYKLEGLSDDLWEAIDNLRDIVGGLDMKYATKDELNSSVAFGRYDYTGQVAQSPDNTTTYLAFFAIVIFGVAYLYYSGRLKRLIPDKKTAKLKKLSNKDKNRTYAELEKEGKL